MGHPQLATSLSTDNSTAAGISNSIVKQRRSKAMVMHYYWVCDRVSMANVLWYGRKEKAIWRIILSNIIRNPITPLSGLRTSTHPRTLRAITFNFWPKRTRKKRQPESFAVHPIIFFDLVLQMRVC
jgi:hypothetical protein